MDPDFPTYSGAVLAGARSNAAASVTLWLEDLCDSLCQKLRIAEPNVPLEKPFVAAGVDLRSLVAVKKALHVDACDAVKNIAGYTQQHQDDDWKIPIETLNEHMRIQMATAVFDTLEERGRQILDLVFTLVRNLIHRPYDEKVRTLRFSNKKLRKLIFSVPRAVSLLELVGFVQTKVLRKKPPFVEVKALVFPCCPLSNTQEGHKLQAMYSMLDDLLPYLPPAEEDGSSEATDMVSADSQADDANAHITRACLADIHENRLEGKHTAHTSTTFYQHGRNAPFQASRKRPCPVEEEGFVTNDRSAAPSAPNGIRSLVRSELGLLRPATSFSADKPKDNWTHLEQSEIIPAPITPFQASRKRPRSVEEEGDVTNDKSATPFAPNGVRSLVRSGLGLLQPATSFSTDKPKDNWTHLKQPEIIPAPMASRLEDGLTIGISAEEYEAALKSLLTNDSVERVEGDAPFQASRKRPHPVEEESDVTNDRSAAPSAPNGIRSWVRTGLGLLQRATSFSADKPKDNWTHLEQSEKIPAPIAPFQASRKRPRSVEEKGDVTNGGSATPSAPNGIRSLVRSGLGLLQRATPFCADEPKDNWTHLEQPEIIPTPMESRLEDGLTIGISAEEYEAALKLLLTNDSAERVAGDAPFQASRKRPRPVEEEGSVTNDRSATPSAPDGIRPLVRSGLGLLQRAASFSADEPKVNWTRLEKPEIIPAPIAPFQASRKRPRPVEEESGVTNGRSTAPSAPNGIRSLLRAGLGLLQRATSFTADEPKDNWTHLEQPEITPAPMASRLENGLTIGISAEEYEAALKLLLTNDSAERVEGDAPFQASRKRPRPVEEESGVTNDRSATPSAPDGIRPLVRSGLGLLRPAASFSADEPKVNWTHLERPEIIPAPIAPFQAWRKRPLPVEEEGGVTIDRSASPSASNGARPLVRSRLGLLQRATSFWADEPKDNWTHLEQPEMIPAPIASRLEDGLTIGISAEEYEAALQLLLTNDSAERVEGE